MAATDTLSLDPQGQFADQIGAWENGQTYTVVLTVQQTAPGKFAVQNLTAHDDENAAETAAPGDEPETPTPIAAAKSKTGNPAVDGMMS